MTAPRLVPLRDLQPSQILVSREKLEAVVEGWPDRRAATLPPVPVRRYGDRLVLTDGHSRALAAHRAGLDAIRVVDDRDALDDEAYEICVGWCVDAGIRTVPDLEERVVDAVAYRREWLDRCRDLHASLAARRERRGRS